MKIIRTYSELIRIPSFKERYKYLRLGGIIGESTFGFERYLNQQLYRSYAWKKARRNAILRDNGCDLADPDRLIGSQIYVHHINPIEIEDIEEHNPMLFDPDNLVCCSFDTHQAIHFGDESLLKTGELVERKPWDTCPWRQEG